MALIPLVAALVCLLPVRKEDDSLTLVFKFSYALSKPARGDLVAISLLAGDNAVFLKRVVALPKETIEIRKGIVHLNGRPLDEPADRRNPGWSMSKTLVGDEEYYVIGDDRQQPIELHRMGRIHFSKIIGKALW